MKMCSLHTSGTRHRFPNPQKYPVRFNEWLQRTGNSQLLKTDPVKVYKTHTTCNLHFKTSDGLRNTAVPSLQIHYENTSSTPVNTTNPENATDADNTIDPDAAVTISSRKGNSEVLSPVAKKFYCSYVKHGNAKCEPLFIVNFEISYKILNEVIQQSVTRW